MSYFHKIIGFTRLWRVYPAPAGLPAPGGQNKFLSKVCIIWLKVVFKTTLIFPFLLLARNQRFIIESNISYKIILNYIKG